MIKIIKRLFMFFMIFSFTSLFLACFDSDKNDEEAENEFQTINGIVAVGSPISGKIYVKDQNGNTVSSTINDKGLFEVDITEHEAPFIIMAEGSKVNSTDKNIKRIYSITDKAGLVNVTPATNMALALAIKNDPAISYSAEDIKNSNLIINNFPTSEEINNAKDKITEKIKPVYSTMKIPDDFDIFTSSFSADHTGFDLLLDVVDLKTEIKDSTPLISISVQDKVFYEENVSTNEVVVNRTNEIKAAVNNLIPVIKSVVLTTSDSGGDTIITLTIDVESNVPVNWFSGSFYGPNGNIWGGGNGKTFTEISPGVWRLVHTDRVSKSAPSGEYYYTDISVKNESMFSSNKWTQELKTTIDNTIVATKPVITSIDLTTSDSNGNTIITLTIDVESNVPVNWLTYSFNGPTGIIMGGGSSKTSTAVSPGIWRLVQTNTVSKYAPSGEYFYTGISVKSEGALTSDEWPGELKTSISNSIVATKPVITSIDLTTSDSAGDTIITLTIDVESNAPVVFLSGSFDSPNGNIWGGGSGKSFTEVSPGIWRLIHQDTVSKNAPGGEYSYTGISVENEGMKISDVWAGELKTYINNPIVATKPVITSIDLTTSDSAGDTIITLTIDVESNVPVNILSGYFYGPNGNIWYGGNERTFTKVSTGVWRLVHTDTVPEHALGGEYYYTGISVENEGDLRSDVWTRELKTTIDNPTTPITPVITSIDLTTSDSNGDTIITLTIDVESNVPVVFLNGSFKGPNGTIWGGGNGRTFTEVSAGVWRFVQSDRVSKYAPSGEYYYTGISVENEEMFISNVWAEELKTSISNSIIATKPVITSIDLATSDSNGNTIITLTIDVESNAPVVFLSGSFNGPDGNIWGGANGRTFTEESPGVWRFVHTDIVSKNATSGEYYYTGISVDNEGMLSSDVWIGELKTTINN